MGVLFDLYGARTMPWRIHVRFQNYPTDRLLRCPDEDTIMSHFRQSLKEAVFMRHGDIDVVNELSKEADQNLWAGFYRSASPALADNLLHVAHHVLDRRDGSLLVV